MGPNAERQKIAQEFGIAAELAAAIPGATPEEVRENWDVINKFRPQAGAGTPPAPQVPGGTTNPPANSASLDVSRLEKQIEGLSAKFGAEPVQQALGQITGLAQQLDGQAKTIAQMQLDGHRNALALKHGLTPEVVAQLPGATPAELDASLQFALQLRGQNPGLPLQSGAKPPVAPLVPQVPPVRLVAPPVSQPGTIPQNPADQILANFRQQVSEFASQ